MADADDTGNAQTPRTGGSSGALHALKGSGVFSPQEFGAAGDGVTDDTAALRAALYYLGSLPGSQLVDRSGASYLLSAPIEVTGTLDLDWGTSRLIAPFTGPILSFSDTDPDGPYPLSEDYAAGSVTLKVSGLATALPAGTRIRIVSDATDPANRDRGSLPEQYRVAEWALLAQGSTANQLILTAPLRFTDGISPTSTPGDEPRTSAYCRAMNARVLIMSDTHVFRMRGGILHRGSEDARLKGDALRLRYFRTPLVEDLRIVRGHSPGISLTGTMAAQIVRPQISDLTDDIGNGNYGYGISDQGWLSRIDGGLVSRARHAYTTGGNAIPAGTSDKMALVSSGRIVGAMISQLRALDMHDSAFDTHHDAEDVTFEDCVAEGGAKFAFAARGRNIRIVRPRARRCAKGLYLFTELVRSVPDGDFFTAGKTATDFTSVIVDSPDIQCTNEALSISLARVEFDGRGRFRSRSCALAAMSGSVLIAADLCFRTTDELGPVTEPDLPALKLRAPHPVAPFETTVLTIPDGARLEVDGRDGTGAPLDPGTERILIGGALCLGVPDRGDVTIPDAALGAGSSGTVMLRARADRRSAAVSIPPRPGLRVLWDDGTWVCWTLPGAPQARLPHCSDNAAARAAGLHPGQIYQTATGELRIVV